MSSSSLFAILNIGTRGMSAQQGAIDVTSHNIANANTDGYSRQRAIIETTRPFGMPSLNSAAEPGQLGTGSQIASIQRVRDTFLDYQVRVETSTQGQYTARDTYLGNVESIFNEPSDNGISSLIGSFFNSWQTLANDAQSSNSRTIVVQQASALSDELNHTATQLANLKQNAQSNIKDDVFQINDILNQIDKLNQQIITVNVSGKTPNDLMDKRDQLLDSLSSKFNINIDKKNFDGTNVSPVDTAAGFDSTMVKSVNNTDVKRLSYVDNITKNTDGTYNITYYTLGDESSSANARTLSNVSLSASEYKQLDENRVLWSDKDGVAVDASGNELVDNPSAPSPQFTLSNLQLFTPSDGELKGYMSVQSDIDSYMGQLDNLAKTLAFSVNAVLSGVTGSGATTRLDSNGNPVAIQTTDYMPFFVNGDVANSNYTIEGSKNVLYDSSDPTTLAKLNNVLNSESNITAANISVNKQLVDDVMQIKTRLNDDEFATEGQNNLDGANDGKRAMAVAQLRNSLMMIQNINTSGAAGITSRADLFDAAKGGNSITVNSLGVSFTSNSGGTSMDNYFKDLIDKLGVQESQAKRVVTNQNTLLASFQQSRESNSGVSIDEEMANLIQYQHAYQANAKVISTVDDLLDVVVNGLKK
jgi:flagellar hook-associated protein 1 FlgK